MVDYDYIHALFGGISYFFDVGNSAVNCDYEGTEILFEFIDGIFVEAQGKREIILKGKDLKEEQEPTI